jgi:hypothetical protein
MKAADSKKDELLAIARRLAALVPGQFEVNETGNYVSLDVGSGNPKNAIGIHSNYVTFSVLSEELLRRAKDIGIVLLPFRRKGQDSPSDHFQILDLQIGQITQNEELFRCLVIESANAVLSEIKQKAKNING